MTANNKQVDGTHAAYLIALTKGFSTVVDEDIFLNVGHLNWCALTPSPALTYAVRYEKGKFIYLHRLVLEASKGTVVDHISGNTLDNRRENLRFVSKTENSINKQGGYGVSVYRGVWYAKNRNKPWVAEIKIQGTKKILGYFKTEKEAADAYDKVLMQFFPFHGRPNNAE